jgi:hypothetical protein
MSTGINYEFNKETFMGSSPFDDLWNVTHKIPSTKKPVYEGIDDDVDECDEDNYEDDLCE